MTNRKKIIIIGSSIVVIIAAIVVTIILSNPSPQPADIDTTPASTDPSNPPEEEEHPYLQGTDSHGEPLPEETQQAIKRNATQAAEAYVTQNKNEEPAARTSRLNPFFTPTSPVPTAKPPIEDTTYSTAQVSTVESSWYDLEKAGSIGVIIYVKVTINTGFGDYEEYQSWVVELIQYNGAWLSHTITKSDLPYIQGVN